MIKLVTSAEMKEMDRTTIEDLGIPGVVLMENAGMGTFRIIQHLLKNVEGAVVHLFCGKGNNGGDGYVIARHLHDAGAAVQVFIIGQEKDIRGDARINFEILRKMSIPFSFISRSSEIEERAEFYPDLVVDALLGTGIQGAVRGFMKEVIELINQYECPVVSVDIASGLDADSPEVAGAVVRADFTVTMALPKRCHLFYPAKNYCGELYIADIGIPANVRTSEKVQFQIVEKSNIMMPARPADAHKYTCGKVGVLAGSPGFTGAAALTAEAALRVGAGLTILAVPEELNPILETKLTEVITRPYPTGRFKYFQPESVSHLDDFFEWCDVLAIGPGLGRSPETQEAVALVFEQFQKPLVIDADALLALANHPQLIKKLPPQYILTPHLGEFARLVPEHSREELKVKFPDIAQRFAVEHKTNLLLKGAPSLLAAADGRVYVNSTGNPGLASGGTGDVLTGMIAGLLAQGMGPAEAGYTANFLHGLCADNLVKEKTEYTFTATDLIQKLGHTLAELLKEAQS